MFFFSDCFDGHISAQKNALVGKKGPLTNQGGCGGSRLGSERSRSKISIAILLICSAGKKFVGRHPPICSRPRRSVEMIL